MSASFLSIDVGGTSVKMALMDAAAGLLAEDGFPTGPEIDNDAFARALRSALDRLCPADRPRPLACGMGVPGPLDNEAGTIVRTGNMPLLRDLPARALVENHLGIPCAIENDANLAALGEYDFGAARGHDTVLFFTLGTGVGGGLIYRGELVTGYRGNSMEIGHIVLQPGGATCSCGNSGCLEAYSSLSGIHRRLRGEFPGRDFPYSLRELLAHPEAAVRERLADLLLDAGRYLGIAAATCVQLFAPNLILFTGGLARAWTHFQPGFDRGLEESSFAVMRAGTRIEVKDTGAGSGLLGGLALARRLYNRQRAPMP